MSYTRKFKRTYERANNITSEPYKSNITLAQRVVAAVTAAGFVLNPVAALASTITRVDGGQNVVFDKNGVGQVWAGKVVGDAAVNIFDKFNVSAGHIANMYFKTGADAAEQNNLVNFVNSRIDINGTVNAVKNNKIGGNLFFLSKDGMAVGSKGIINTGSLYVMTPAAMSGLEEEQFTYDMLKGAFATGTAVPGTEAYERVLEANIPLNSSGTITVLGKINAADNVGLHAGRIAVGKNISGEEVFGTAQNGIVKEAYIKAGVDFSNIVNIDTNPEALAGVQLQVQPGTGGDIVLAAKAEYGNVDNAADFLVQSANQLGMADIDMPETITASVENYGSLEAAQDIKITAEATNGNKDLAEDLLQQNTPAGTLHPDYVPVPAADNNRFAYTEAKIDVQGNITAHRNVELSASSDNTFVDGTGIGDNIPLIGSILGHPMNPIQANVMLLGSEASVNIASGAKVTAKENISITAGSLLDATLGASAANNKLIGISSKVPVTGVSYAKTENKANVTVNGAVEILQEKTDTASENSGAGNIAIKAKAEENLAHSVSVIGSAPLAGDAPAVAAAIGITESSNKSSVEINGRVTNELGDVSVKADTLNLLNSTVTSNAADKSSANIAMNYLAHTSAADVIIAGDINAKGDLVLEAVNTMDENTVMANNTIGMGKFQAELLKAADVNGITAALKGRFGELAGGTGNTGSGTFGKLSGLLGGGDKGKEEVNRLFSAGATIAVAEETNTANITVKNTADLTAGNSLKADAQMAVLDTQMSAIGKTNSYKQDATKENAVSAGVLYADIDNSAGVTIEDGTSASDEGRAQLKAKNISLNSATTMEYNRVDRLIREITRSIEKIDYAIAALKSMPEDKKEQYEELLSGLETLKNSLGGYAGSFTEEFKKQAANPDAMTNETLLQEIVNYGGAALPLLDQVQNLQMQFGDLLDVTSPVNAVVSNALGVVTGALAFTDPTNYANFSAGAGATGGGDTKLSLSGAASITNLNHNSKVQVGSYAAIDAEEKAELKSGNSIDAVNVTGKKKFYKLDTTAAGGIGVGGSVNYQNFDTDSKVTVAEGAQIAAKNIDIASESDIFHVGVMMNAGKGDGSALSGMVSYVDSDSLNGAYVDDEAVLDAGDAINISAKNDTSASNAIMDITVSGGQAAVGGSAAINDIRVDNTAAVQDIDELLNGSKADMAGKLSASALNVNAETTGLINTISIAGGIASTDTGDDSTANSKGGLLDKISELTGKVTGVDKALQNAINEQSKNLQNAITNFGKAANSQQQGGSNPTQGAEATQGNLGAMFAGAGSVSLNLVEDKTQAVIDGANIELNDKGKLTVGARDTAFVGAWSGAAAMTFRKGDSNTGTSVAISGTAGANDVDNTISALVKNSKISGAKDIDVTALSGGSQIAAGVGTAVAKSSAGSTNIGGSANISLNLIEKNVNASMENAEVSSSDTAAADIDVTAYESDVQVTGGVEIGVAVGGGTTVGGSISVADITNNVKAGISGGSYKNVNAANVQSLLSATQVTAAVSTGVAAGGNGTNNAFSGAVIYSGINNNLTASIDGEAAITAGEVIVTAKDTDKDNFYQEQLGDYKEHSKFASERGIDVDGSSLYKAEGENQGIDTGATADEEAGTEAVDLNADKGGSTIVNAAFVVTAGGNTNAAGAAVNIADINNNFDAVIDNAAIQADDVKVLAEADTLIVNAAGGVAAGTKNFGGMGSVSWQELQNDITATVQNSALTAKTLGVEANNDALAVNVAGQVAYGKSAGVGAAIAYNALDNATGAYLLGNDITSQDEDGVSVDVEAKNSGDVYGIGASVAASNKAAISGTVVINRGGSNTEAVIDEYDEDKNETTANKRGSISNAREVNAVAEDDTQRMAVVGNVSGSAKAAVGAGVAYNDVGGSSGDTAKAQQHTRAAVNNTDIVTVQNAVVNVSALDKSQLTTIGVGIGGSGKVAVQGAAATALINKNVTAEMEDTGIDADKANNTDVTVKADTENKVTTNASVVAASGSAAVGAGVAVNRSQADVNAVINGGRLNVGNVNAEAVNNAEILSIGIGAGVAVKGAAVNGSVAVNQIDNDTTAKISGGAQIDAANNVIVDAISDEQIANYAGSLSVAGVGAAVGLSVSVNQIDGSTAALIDGNDTSVTAHAKGEAGKVKDSVEDGAILDHIVDKDAFDSNTSLADKRKESGYKGVAVSASSTHSIKSFLANGGVAGEGAAVNGTVNVNTVDGSTLAAIRGADINKDVDMVNNIAMGNPLSNVSVVAHDYTNSAGIVGTVSVGGIGAGVGLGSDTNTVSRDVTAEVSENSTVNAGSFKVDADAQQGIASLTTSGGVAGIGAGVGNATSVTLLDGKTTAKVQNANILASKFDVLANHTGKINTLGTALGGGGLGAGVGIGVSVLNENSVTEAIVDNSTISFANDKNDASVKAENTTKVNYQLYNMGGAVAGVAGSVGVANVNSKVNTIVQDSVFGGEDTHTTQVPKLNENSEIIEGEYEEVEVSRNKAHDVAIQAKNNIDFTNKSGAGAGGAVGVGVGVAINTIDSQVNTLVKDSTIYAANDVNVTAEEIRTVNQLAVNASAGAGAGGANVMITNVGKAVSSAYGKNLQTDAEGNVTGGSVDIDALYKQANNAVNDNKLQSDYTLGGVGSDDAAANTKVEAKKGSDNAAEQSMVKASLDGAVLHADNKADIKAVEDTNVKMDGINASAGLTASVSGAVGILDVHRNSGVEVADTEIKAKELALTVQQKGVSDLDIYQGTLGGIASIGAAYASASSTGKTGVGIGGSSFTITNGIDIKAQDQSRTSIDAIGVALAAGGAASIIVAQGTNDSETAITVADSEMTAESGDIDVLAERMAVDEDGNKTASLDVNAIAGSGGVGFAGSGVGATATEIGKVAVTVSGSDLSAAENININALNAAFVNAKTGAIAGSTFAAVAGAGAIANLGDEDHHLETIVNIDVGNSFTAGTESDGGIHINAVTEAEANVDMEGMSIAAYGGAAQVNVGKANSYSDVKVTVAGDNTYKGHDGSVDVDISGVNNLTQSVTAKGISAGTWVASGTNEARSKSNLITKIDIEGIAEGSKVNDLTVDGSTSADIYAEASGDGGALVDISPDAARVDNDHSADTDVNISGAYDVDGKFTVNALNGNKIELDSDAVRAAVIGGSGVWLHNKVNNNADVNLENAYIAADGAQNYTAQNSVDYTGDIKGSGYGGLNITGSELTDEFDFNANVNIKGSTLKGTGDEGSITAKALTTGSIESMNSLKAAGVIPTSVANSEHEIDYNNTITVDEGSTLTTAKKDQDITLAATEETEVDLRAIADTQGGVAGAASADLENDLNRKNTINVAGMMESSNDVNLYAGANADGKYSELVVNVVADAYNKTAVPLCTDPSVDNSMSQSNQVNAGGNVDSVRHINLKAIKGHTDIITSSREYNIYTETSGTGSIASTADGSIEGSDEAHDNVVNVSGTYKSGIHNKLNINISGESKVNGEGFEAVKDYSGIQVEITEGKDWFSKDNFEIRELEIENTLKGRYEELQNTLKDYKEGTKEYNNIKAAMDELIDQMQALNFTEQKYNKETGLWEDTGKPADNLTASGMNIDDIIVSGGSINIEGDSLKGSGSLTAQGAPQVNITNSSDLYLMLNDVVIQGKGGELTLNGQAITESNKGGFSGAIASDGISGDKPVINITSTSASSFANNPHAQADIGIYGDVLNSEGNIIIKNNNYNITVNGDANVNAQNVQLIASKGNVTQTSTYGIVNIAGDPISQFQFSEKVAKKIQEKLHDILRAGNELPSFDSYDEYLVWIVKNVGVSPAELGIEFDDFGDYTLSEYVQERIDEGIREDLCREAVEKDGGYFASWKYQMGLYDKEYGEYFTPEKVAAKNTAYKEQYGPNGYYKYLTEELGVSVRNFDYNEMKGSVIDESAGRIAGKNVYIHGVNVNINGLVQAGYGNYSAALDENSQKRIDEILSKHGSQMLTDSQVMSNDNYLVNKGGEYYNKETGVWEYEVKIYYNPYTKKLLVDSVAPEGGQIHINGAVSSTGDGRLMAMDGMANIEINTDAVNSDKIAGIVVNEIANKNIDGLVSITDRQKDLVTEYKNGKYREYKYGTADADKPGWINDSNMKADENSQYTYKPEKGLRYEFTGGFDGSERNFYSYQDYFIAWGLIDYSSGNDLKNKIEESGGTVNVTHGSVEGGKLANGVYIGKGNTGGDDSKDWYVTGSFQREENETQIGDVVENKIWGMHEGGEKKDPDWLGKWWGYGAVEYKWQTSNGVSSSTTTSIKADETIKIGFVGGKKNDGHINISGNQNIELAGNVANAEIDGAGSGYVHITSNNGAIISNNNANIISDDVKLRAETGIDANHVAIGDRANVDLITNTGNIEFVSKAGDVSLKNALTGGTAPIDGNTGNVLISANGSILNASEGAYAIKGQRIDLISTTGSIGTQDKALTIVAGSEMFSANSMDSSVNAKAKEDIVLTQTEGNMRLGSIESANGDAVLTVNDGSFVDAYNENNAGFSDTADKVQQWLDSGLIHEDDSDDESAKAAEAAKNERLEGLNIQKNNLAKGDSSKITAYEEAAKAFAEDTGLKAAKDAYIKAVQDAKGDTAKIEAAYDSYKAAQKEFFAGQNFTSEEQDFIASYAEVSGSDNYGWSKNQLLYAIQDSVINSEPGQKVNSNTYSNVTANNITLNAANGGIGVDGEAMVIDYAELSNVDNLKLLAAAKAGDLTWNDEAGTVTVRQQKAINIKANNADGQVNVNGKDNVYLAGIKDSTLNITGVETDGNIKLQADNGVYMLGDNRLTGNNLTISGGDGGIGTSDKHINTELRGWLDANAKGDIYIDQNGNMIIMAVASDGNVNLTTTGNMLMVNETGKDMGYINAGDTINLQAAQIGAEGQRVRIYNNGAVVNAAADGDIYLEGREDGTMVLGVVDGQTLDIVSEGDVALGREAGQEQEAVEGQVSIKGSQANIEAQNIDLSNGSLTVNDMNSTVTLQAQQAISQSEAAGGVKANTLNATSGAGQQFASVNNDIANYNVHGLTDNTINGNVEFVSKHTFGVTANLNGVTVNGSVSIRSLADNAGLNISGGVSTAGESGSVSFNSAGALTNDGNINSSADVTVNAAGAISQNGDITAAGNAAVTGDKGEVTLKGEVEAGESVSVTTGSGAVSLGGNVSAAAGSVGVTTTTGNVAVTGGVAAGTDVSLNTERGDITAGGNMKAGANAVLHSGSGNITVKGNMEAGENAELTVDEQGNITLGGTTKGENVNAKTKDGSITFSGAVTSTEGNVNASVTGKGDITVADGAEVNASRDINLSTNEGGITTDSELHAEQDVNAEANVGDITFNDNVTANKNITVKIHTEGNITSADGVKLTALNNNMLIESKNGDIDLYDLYAQKDMDIIAGNGNIDLHNINGEVVAIVLKTPGTTQHVNNITAGSQIILEGSDIDLDEIERRVDADGVLVITPKGTDGKNPMDYFRIGSLSSQGGIRMDHIWAKVAELNVVEGKFYIDKLYIEDEAHFSRGGFATSVYGRPFVNDGSDSVYWNNPKYNPRTDLDSWNSKDGTGWYYLNFEEQPTVQSSNMVLISLADYHYAYNQRFAAVNHAEHLAGDSIEDLYQMTQEPGLTLYSRYYNYDLPAAQQNASEDEVVIEL